MQKGPVTRTLYAFLLMTLGAGKFIHLSHDSYTADKSLGLMALLGYWA
jgi:hypothetical protein